MIMSDSSISEDDLDSEFDQTGYFSVGGDDLLYLFIETLTGTSFEMRVSPVETIMAIKAKLQQLEGIPVNQQHLLYNNTQLNNNHSLQDCGIPDGATLKLVLAMRGGPINTRKIILPEDTAKEIQDAVERNKDDFLGQIPEGGHVTVLVFRDGDDINLYHVLEKPDGSYSPLSDSWSGSSIRNLFAEPDDPDVQQRIHENSNTMTKMQELRNKMENLQLQKTRLQLQDTLRPDNFLPQAQTVNLPPISRSQLKSWDQPHLPEPRDREVTTITELGRKQRTRHNATNQNLFPAMNPKKNESNIDFTDTPPLSKRNSDSNFVFGNPVPQRQSVLRSNQGRQSSLSNRPSSKMISLDIAELKRTVDDNEGFNPSRRTPSRGQASRRHRRRNQNPAGKEDLSSDIFVRTPVDQSKEVPNFLNSSQTSLGPQPPQHRVHQKLHRSLAESEFRHTHQRRRSGKNSRSEPDIKKVIEDQINGNYRDNPRVPFATLSPVQNAEPFSIDVSQPAYTSTLSNLGASSPGPRGLERRLLNSRRGRLSRPLASAAKSPRMLASPKGHKSPRSGDGRLRPTFQTRPLSGPKKKKSSKPKCRLADCRKKLTITNSFSCRCGEMFCPKHRHPETHSCSFDYKTEGRKILEANNPIISIPKLPKI